jgi:SpoVK/Ycf46/Vps4 family AAA+-type ATPase
LYIILPSTRITLTESNKPECDESKGKALKSAETTSLNLSPSAVLLIETIQCLRRAKSVTVPRAFLLTGPPGVGKTHSVRLAVEASETEGPTRLVSLQGSELLSTASHPAEASKALQRHFREAARFCRNDNHVGIVFLDECEALLSSDTVAAMFANLLDMVSCSSEEGWQRLVIVAATNRIDAVPAWLRRPGRLDREIALAPPDAATRVQIIKTLLQQSSLAFLELPNNTQLNSIAEACVGYVPADLAALVRRAALLAFQEHTLQVTSDLLQRAMSDVGASVSFVIYSSLIDVIKLTNVFYSS